MNVHLLVAHSTLTTSSYTNRGFSIYEMEVYGIKTNGISLSEHPDLFSSISKEVILVPDSNIHSRNQTHTDMKFASLRQVRRF